jgi:methylphosphotriester-DNA--protein-cysteine methyltransferase
MLKCAQGDTMLERERRCALSTKVIALILSNPLAATLATVANRLNMSRSSLRQHLRNEGRGFREIRRLGRVLKALSELNSDPGIKVEALAMIAGFKTRKALYDAVSWATGRSLQEVRASKQRRTRQDFSGVGPLA